MWENIYIHEVSLTSSKNALIKTNWKSDKIIEIICVIDNKSTYIGSTELDSSDDDYDQIKKILKFTDLYDVKFKLDEDRLKFSIFTEEQCPVDSQSMVQHILLTMPVIKASGSDLNSILSSAFREQFEMRKLQEKLAEKDQEISTILKNFDTLKEQNDKYLKSILPNCMALVNSKKAKIVELERQLEKFTKPEFENEVRRTPKKSPRTPKKIHKIVTSEWISPSRRKMENLSKSSSVESTSKSPKKRTPIKSLIDFGFKKLREESSSDDEEIGESSKSKISNDNFLRDMKPVKVIQQSKNDENSPEVMNDIKRARSQDDESNNEDCKKRRTNEIESNSSTTKSGEYGTPPAMNISSEEIFAQRLTPDDDEIVESSQPSFEVVDSPNIFSTQRIRLRSQKSQQSTTNDKNKSKFSIDTEEF